MTSLFVLFPHLRAAELALQPFATEHQNVQFSLVVLRSVLSARLEQYARPARRRLRGSITGGRLSYLIGLLIGRRAVEQPAIGRVVLTGPIAGLATQSDVGIPALLGTLGLPPKITQIYTDGVRDGKVIVGLHAKQIDPAWVTFCTNQGGRCDLITAAQADTNLNQGDSPMKLFALFNDETTLSSALKALQNAGVADNDIEMLRVSAAERDVMPIPSAIIAPTAGASLGHGAPLPQMDWSEPPTEGLYQALLTDRGVPAQEASFLAQAMLDGAEVAIIETDDEAATRSVLEAHDARVYTV